MIDAMDSLAARYDVALLDLDGVVYVGDHAVGHATEALVAARTVGMSLTFVTNNASRPPDDVAERLRSFGVPASGREVVTSAQAAARVLAEQVPAGARILVIGGAGLEHALRERDLQPVAGMADDPAAVVQGFDPSIDWSRLAEASYGVHAGLLWVASNTDSTIPTPRGIAPGNGTLVAAVRAATGRGPIVAGKPELPMHREAVDRSGSRRPLVVGDRLDTDIEAANRAGVPALLVLTGVTDGCDAAMAPVGQRPQFIGADLRALLREPAALAVTPGQARAGRWRATVDAAGNAVLDAEDEEWSIDANADDHVSGTSVAVHDDHTDAVRALCGAVWARHDAEPDTVVDLTDVAATLRSLTPATVEP